jgi:AcrR family transcriptional regulator/DNA-binding MarR family transcriptional regulator
VRTYKQAGSEEVARQGGHVAEMQRRRLLLAMGELLAEIGIEDATVGRISKRAGVSRRTFYEVFEDREECFLAALDQAVARIAVEVAPAYAREGNWSVRLRAALAVLLEHFDAHPGVARMCVVETLRAGPEVLERRRRVLAALSAAVDEGRAEVRQGNEPLPLTAEGVVGGALAVIHARLLATPRIEALPTGKAVIRSEGAGHQPLGELVNPLTAMVVHPYIGPAAARRELDRPAPRAIAAATNDTKDPFKDLSIRFTYRTARVLATIAQDSGASNRMIAGSAGINDEGQTSRLLRRLQAAGLIENLGEGHTRGEPNAWWLTERGEAIHATLAGGERVS